MPARTVEELRLFVSPRNPSRGVLLAGPLRAPAALGANGLTHRPREGDRATPAGRLRLLGVYYRPDRVARPRTALPLRPLRPDDGWCDDPASGRYNRPVRHPFPASAERLWREDHIYDIIVVLDFNIHPRVRGRGSAIFFHVACPDLSPTLGCIAVPAAHMRRILRLCGPRTVLRTDAARLRIR